MEAGATSVFAGTMDHAFRRRLRYPPFDYGAARRSLS